MGPGVRRDDANPARVFVIIFRGVSSPVSGCEFFGEAP